MRWFRVLNVGLDLPVARGRTQVVCSDFVTSLIENCKNPALGPSSQPLNLLVLIPNNSCFKALRKHSPS